jgi:hypothetical protein
MGAQDAVVVGDLQVVVAVSGSLLAQSALLPGELISTQPSNFSGELAAQKANLFGPLELKAPDKSGNIRIQWMPNQMFRVVTNPRRR